MPSFGKRTPFSDQYLQPFEDCFHATERKEADGNLPLSFEGKGRGEGEIETPLAQFLPRLDQNPKRRLAGYCMAKRPG
jgi:hypothetical protein